MPPPPRGDHGQHTGPVPRPPTGAAGPTGPVQSRAVASAFDDVPVTAPPSYDQAGGFTGPVSSPQGEAGIHTRIVELDPEGDRHTRIVDVSVPAMVRRAARERVAEARGGLQEDEAPPTLIEDMMTGLRHFYLRMHRLDRWTAWLLGLCFIGAFLPWRRVLGLGLVSGIEGYGGISAGASALAFTFLYLRTERRRLAGLMISLQLLAVIGIAGAPIFLVLGRTGQHFAFGFFMTGLGAGIALLLSLARLTRINA